jgi:hypothetical protein
MSVSYNFSIMKDRIWHFLYSSKWDGVEWTKKSCHANSEMCAKNVLTWTLLNVFSVYFIVQHVAVSKKIYAVDESNCLYESVAGRKRSGVSNPIRSVKMYIYAQCTMKERPVCCGGVPCLDHMEEGPGPLHPENLPPLLSA